MSTGPSRRALFTYSVFHSQVGLSAEDAIYGSMKMTWNDYAVDRLYLSTIELTNESSQDFESVTASVYTDSTRLLADKTVVLGTTKILEYTDEYKRQLEVSSGERPTPLQYELYYRRKDYLISTMNRRQTVRFEFLNEPKPDEQPSIWLEILEKGVKLEFKPQQNQFAGVPQPTAVRVGILVGLIFVSVVLMLVNDRLIVALLAYAIGLLVILPGIYAIKAYQKVRDWIVG